MRDTACNTIEFAIYTSVAENSIEMHILHSLAPRHFERQYHACVFHESSPLILSYDTSSFPREILRELPILRIMRLPRYRIALHDQASRLRDFPRRLSHTLSFFFLRPRELVVFGRGGVRLCGRGGRYR
jgi:hypothetical protein